MASLSSLHQLDHRYGYFDWDRREFVITDIATPRPWAHVMSNDSYGVVLSHLGGGFCWVENCQLQRLTRWDQDLTLDTHGRFLYVVNRQDRSQIWSTTYRPTDVEADHEIVRYGLGYAVFERLVGSIFTRHSLHVDPEQNVEYWIVEIENRGDAAAELALCSSLDWQLGRNTDWHREFHRLFIETQNEQSTILAWKHPGLHEHSFEVDELPYVAFHAVAGARPSAFYRSRTEFFGPLGSAQTPYALMKGHGLEGSDRWDDPMAGIQVDVNLGPGETRVVCYTIGAEPTAAEAQAAATRGTVEEAVKSRQRAIDCWEDALRLGRIQTPDPLINGLTNDWFRYQTIAGRLMARAAYYQQGGAYGYRDQLQDSLALLDCDPQRTLLQLERHAEAMYEDGGVRHWWHPGFPIHIASKHSDTCLWLAYGLLAYLDETNDLACLDKELRFLNRKTEDFGASGTLRDHAERGIALALSRRSERGLPLIGSGDWNDGLSHAGLLGKGESVWLAMFLFEILQRWARLVEDLGDRELAAKYVSEAENLRQAVEAHGWDGDWYLAGYRDTGEPFGSHQNRYGQLFLNPQTWAVLTGIGSPERVASAMSHVDDRLLQPYGALLLAPAYREVDPTIGYITRYAPGLRENGGVYSHASTWAVLAKAKLGRLDEALGIYRAMLPAKDEERAERYAAEPYVMPGNVDGPDSPYEARAGWTWYTGSSAWMVRVAKEALLGVQVTRAGVTLGDCVSEFEEWSYQRAFGSGVLTIRSTGSGPIRSVRLNGEVKATFIPREVLTHGGEIEIVRGE